LLHCWKEIVETATRISPCSMQHQDQGQRVSWLVIGRHPEETIA
jgi:hypothetical protein